MFNVAHSCFTAMLVKPYGELLKRSHREIFTCDPLQQYINIIVMLDSLTNMLYIGECHAALYSWKPINLENDLVFINKEEHCIFVAKHVLFFSLNLRSIHASRNTLRPVIGERSIRIKNRY